MAYLAVSLSWVAGLASFVVLVLHDHPWWGLVALVVGGLARYQKGPTDR